jgi:hypothetical protein
MEDKLVWLIDAKSNFDVKMSIVHKSKIPIDALYRGIEKDGNNFEVYNTKTSPDKDYRPVIKE